MNVNRRKVIQNLSLAAGVSAAGLSALTWRAAIGAEAPRLDVKDPAARAQGYVEHVSQVDPKKYPGFVPGSSCENCLQLQGTAGNNYRPCSVFAGKLVSVSGWCKSWTPEM
jgi:hypothetical protein